jgi:ClpP class serine protease
MTYLEEKFKEIDDKVTMSKREQKKFLEKTLDEQADKFVRIIKEDYPNALIASTFGYQQHKREVLSQLNKEGLI